MIIPYYIKWGSKDSSRSLPGPRSSIVSFRTVAGTITRFDIWAVAGTGDATFNLLVNGVAQFSGGGRPVLAAGTETEAVTGLSIAVDDGDLISIDLEVVSSGAVDRPEFQFLIDDGVSGGAESLDDLSDVVITTPAVDDVIIFDGADFVNAPAPTGGVVDLDDLADVVITTPTLDDVLKYNGSNWVNDSAPGGSVLGLYSPDIPYVTPSTEDDEFNAGSLDSKWIAVPSATVPTLTWTIPNNMGGVRGATNQISGYQQAYAPAADTVWIAKITPALSAAGGAGIMFKIAGGNYWMSLHVEGASVLFNTWIAYNNLFITHTTQTIEANNPAVTTCYLKLQYIHSTKGVTAYFSYNGITWFPIGTNQTTPSSGALNNIGFYFYGGNNVSQIDWIRRLQGVYTGANY